MEDILIDTDVVIEYLRSKEKPTTDLIKLLQKHDVFLSSISEFELYLGARTERHQKDLEMNSSIPIGWKVLHSTHVSNYII